MRNRKVQKELKQQGYYKHYGKNAPERKMITEERLNRTMECGIVDPTPQIAVDRMILEQMAWNRAARAKVRAKNKTKGKSKTTTTNQITKE